MCQLVLLWNSEASEIRAPHEIRKNELGKTLIKPAVTYENETWVLTLSDLNLFKEIKKKT